MTPTLLPVLAALALCGALLPTLAQAETEAPKCRYIDIGSLPLRYTGPSLSVTTEGKINGAPATMLVDTGAFDTMLTKTGVERRNLAMHATGRTARGIGGDAPIYQAQVDDLSVGPTASGRAALKVLADFGFVPDYDALIGAPFLLQADMEISLSSKSLRFFRPSNCGDHFLAYWDENAMAIPFANQRSSRSPNPQFFVHVNGKRMRAVIDTGASTTVIGRAAAQRAGLKLDAPGVTRLSDSVGIGRERVARWSTVFDTFQIGEETVRNAQIGVIDWEDDIDILLGADFLRSHRVLFAMSQRKIYLSYVGGEPFVQRNRIEPWIVEEAEAGNADAQLVLAGMYTRGKEVPKDAALGARWLEKASRGGNPEANLAIGRQLTLRGSAEAGAALIRSALDKQPSNREAALWLYLAHMHSKQPELAKTELAASAARNPDNAWPGPIAGFYLGTVTAEALLAAAGRDAATARPRTCEALGKMAQWHAAHGDHTRAAAVHAQGRATCGQPGAPVTQGAGGD